MQNTVHSTEEISALCHLCQTWEDFIVFADENPSSFFDAVLAAMKRTVVFELSKYNKLLGLKVDHNGLEGEITAVTTFARKDVIVTFNSGWGTCSTPLKELTKMPEYASTFLEEN
jgi:hypothetical protein